MNIKNLAEKLERREEWGREEGEEIRETIRSRPCTNPLDRKKRYRPTVLSGAVRGFQKGGGEISNVVVSNATRPEGPRLRRDRVQRCTGKFSRGAQARPEWPRIRAEARRAEAAGDLIFEPL